MAIDTQSKRRSVQAYTSGLMRPVPDGTVAVADRATATWLYAGPAYSGDAPVATNEWILRFRRRGRR
jgi:hypothetical protein